MALSDPRGLWASFAGKVGQGAQQGDPRAAAVLRRIAGSQDTSGGFQNAANDQLRGIGVNEYEYADPNRKQKLGTLGNIARVLGTGAGIAALGLSGGALLGGLGKGGAAVAGAAKQGGGLGGTLRSVGQGLGVINPNGGINPLGLARLGLGIGGVIQGAGAQGKANQALGRAVAPVNVPMPDLSPIFADPNNPYARQAGPNTAQLAALQALRSR